MQFVPTTQSSFSSSNLLALDIMLKTFLASPEFNEMPDKNWNAITRLIPGTTARQCQRRYEELMKEAMTAAYTTPLSRPASSTAITSRTPGLEGPSKGSRPCSAKAKGVKPEKETGSAKNQELRPLSGDQGPVMVIHVCDEAKNLKQDFHCPRDLLIREMKYFAEYLSTDAQRWEEVDISVHCDVQIFEWLMKYVKRLQKEMANPPILEPTNVISILISSDFLKMEALVQECIEFCHKNMTAIVSTPCNMNCINDKLAGRIADLFNHNEADDVKDRKDKFKSKLFAKKLEKLFCTGYSSSYSPENASTLYKCAVCKKLLTSNLETRVKCLQSRTVISQRGELCYSHIRDVTWDVNDHLVELKNQLKNWRDVYWRIWGTVNYLSCSRCGETFACSELGHCRYHPEQAQYGDGSPNSPGAIGQYQCCALKILRYDPTLPNNSYHGCKLRDHIVLMASKGDEGSGGKSDGDKQCEKQQVYDDLLAHRDAVCVAAQGPSANTSGDMNIDVFAREESACGVRSDLMNPTSSYTSLTDDLGKNDGQLKGRLQALTIEREVSYDDDFGFGESDDEVGDEEEGGKATKARKPRRSRVTVDPKGILLDAPDFSTIKQRKWDSSRSLRWNQDAQREEDQRRMNDITSYLTKLRHGADKLEKMKQKEYAGGTFSRLDAQWKASNVPLAKNSQPPFRYGQNKPRLTQLVTK